MAISLNDRSYTLTAPILSGRRELPGAAVSIVRGATVIDVGVASPGSLAAGRLMARVCLAGLGRVAVLPGEVAGVPCPFVTVETDHPLLACLHSQYAGWAISHERWFAMGSGPMRARLAREPFFQHVGREDCDHVVGVLETSSLPPAEAIDQLCSKLDIEPHQLILWAARTASLAGGVQVVARSVETCLHKLHELGFDVATIVSAVGRAPLPPVPRKDLEAIGRTNDAILYGGEVCIWAICEDAAIESIGPRVPSSASSAYGQPFAEIFKGAGGDFYKIDKMLFSPAVVTINNLATGRTFVYGKTDVGLLARTWFDRA